MPINNRISRRIGRFERFDPDAIDGDNDGIVQETTQFERPATPRNMTTNPVRETLLSGSMSGQGGMWSIRELQDLAIAQGWTVRRGKNNHPQFIRPDGRILGTSSTPSDSRAYLNFISDLRKGGLVIPRKGGKPKETSTAFSLEQSRPTLSPEDKTNALRLVAAKQKPGTKLNLDQLAETLEIDDDDIKNELRDVINEKFKDYFPSTAPAEVKPEERKLNNREKRRRGISGAIGLGDSADKTPKSLVPDSLTKEAEAAGVSLDAILDDSDFDNDVEWSSNSWSFAKTKVQEAGDALIVKKDKDGKTKVLMIRRKTAPFTDGYTLPGGMLDAGETLEQTVDREMEEEVGISASEADSRRYLGEIKARDWDPRFVEGVRVGATRFDVPSNTKAVAASDAAGAEWVSVEDLANGKHRIGFGHAAWLSLAFEDDAELSRKFDILTRASRYRNQELIRRVNEKRKEAGEKLFSGLGSPNKHYIPEGTGPLGARKVQNLGFDLAKVITRNPGFFDKRTEEMFIHRSTHSSAETAKKFDMTEREFDDMLREATQKLEAKIRKDIAESMKKKGRKQGLSGSISTRITGAISEGGGIFSDDSDIGAWVDDLKRRMPKDEWDGEEGEKIREQAARLFSIDISETERQNIIDDLMEWDYVYTDYEPEDDFNYALDDLNESDKDWKDYLEYLKNTDPDEHEFWKDYNPTDGFTQEDAQPSLFDEPWDRPLPRPLSGKKKSKRKLFGWRKNKDKPSRRINKIQFYGHKKMRDKQQEQLELFRKWKQESKWKDLHNAHYDWWAFPIDRGSAAYGDGYSVAGKNIDALKNDPQYMDNLREMASIYAEAMGWDLVKGDWLDSLEWDKGQDPWDQAYGARLYKVARSLQIFGLDEEYKSFSQLVSSLRADDGLRRRIGKADYWDNPDVPFNNVTPGTRRHNRKMQAEFELPKTSTKKRKPLTGGMAAPPRGPRNPGRSPITPSSEPRNRFMRELNVDDWYIFVDDIGEYLKKVKGRDIQLSTSDYRELMKAISIFNSLEAIPTDDNGISVNMSDDQVRQLRIVLKKITEADNKFFNIDEIYNALPTKERPKTIEAGGSDA